ncbi:hypothetical protein EON63_07250 [archaeon]|nr:MAG: hypothetical protein EON63_07250 [archaeon]
MLKDTLSTLLPPHYITITSIYTPPTSTLSTLATASISINYTLTFPNTLILGYPSALVAYNTTSYVLLTRIQAGDFDSVYASAAFAYSASSLYGVSVVPSTYTEMFSVPYIDDLGGGEDGSGKYVWGANIITAIGVVGVLLLAGAVTMVLRSIGCLPSSER